MAFLIPLIGLVPFLGLELFVGLVQAFIFAMLTLVFAATATIRPLSAVTTSILTNQPAFEKPSSLAGRGCRKSSYHHQVIAMDNLCICRSPQNFFELIRPLTHEQSQFICTVIG